jgi:hypothetical protein
MDRILTLDDTDPDAITVNLTAKWYQKIIEIF